MVGVAGKSKGCTTCRRRKIKDDRHAGDVKSPTAHAKATGGFQSLSVNSNTHVISNGLEVMGKELPDCSQIVRTVEGLKKRKPLEEAKTPDEASDVEHLSSPKSEVSGHLMLKETIPSLSLNSSSVEGMRYINFAYESYLQTPDGRNRYTHMPVANLLYAVLAHASPDAALDPAKLAMAMRMCALFHGDPRLLPEARQSYTNALRALQFNLDSMDAAMKDETLAGSCLMALYEWTDPEQTDPGAWLRHMAGLTTLLQARGPYRQRGMLARASFENCRYNLMMHCIFKRRAFGFASQAWLTQPWLGVDKRIDQEIMDHGFKFAALLEETDKGDRCIENTNQIRKLVHECHSSISVLQRLRQELEEVPQLGPEASQEDLTQDANRIMLKITATMIELGLCGSSREAVDRAREKYWHFNSRPGQRYVDNNELSEIENVVPSRSHRIALAKEIVDGAHTIRNRKLTAIGRLLYPLSLASKQLKGLSCPQYEQSVALRKVVQGVGDGVDLGSKQEDFWVHGNAKQKSVTSFDTMYSATDGSG